MKVKFKRLDERAQAPILMTDGAAGFDLTVIDSEVEGHTVIYDTGIAFEIPKGYVGLLFQRSSVYKTNFRMANAVGVIDSDYRGSVMLRFELSPTSLVDILESKRSTIPNTSQNYKIGDRVGQIVFVPIATELEESLEDLSDTSRGEGGFGSTDSNQLEIPFPEQ